MGAIAPREDFFLADANVSPQVQRQAAALADGLSHGSHINPADTLPGVPVTLAISANARLAIDHVAVYFTTDGSLPQGRRGKATQGAVVIAEPQSTLTDPATGILTRQWQAVIPGQPEGTLVRYRIEGWNARGPRREWQADRVDPITPLTEEGRVFAYSVDRFTPPEWLDDAVIYQIFVDRFAAASDDPPMRTPDRITSFHGGTLHGIVEQLDYLEALGVNCLWLSPVFESGSHHGYNPSSHYYVAERLGGNAALRTLVAAAHARGIRVVLDFIANHTSDEHPLFLRARANPGSPLVRWYSFGDWPPYGYRSYAFVRDMPELVTEHPDVRRYLETAAGAWLTDFGVDGLRLDYMVGPSHAFWAGFQRALKQRFPYALTLGEITASPEETEAYAGRVDAAMDFELATLLRQVFAQRSVPLNGLLGLLRQRALAAPSGVRRATLLDNHDMQRFLWLAEGDVDRLTLAAACQLTLPGVPIIYYGTEVGLSQTTDASSEYAYARAPMPWGDGQNRAVLDCFRRLIALRSGHPALRHGATAVLPAEHIAVTDATRAQAEQVGAYIRWTDTEYIVIALNNTTETVKLRLWLKDALATAGAHTDGIVLGNLLAPEDDRCCPIDHGVVEIELPALGAALLAPM